MTVSDISGNKLKVSLTNTEVLSCFGSYERLYAMSSTVKSAVHSLLWGIIEHKGYSNYEKILVQIKAKRNTGCVITVLFSQKREKTNHIFDFFESEDLTQAVLFLYKSRTLKRLKSSLYKMQGFFRLVITCDAQKPFLITLQEFCSRYSKLESELYYTKEYGELLIAKNAVQIYGSAFFKDS